MTFNVLIACHCKSEYLTKNPVVREWRRCKDRLGLHCDSAHPSIQWESTEPVTMHWLDPDTRCPRDSQQFHSWSDVQHYDIIWSMYCNIYEYLTAPNRSTEISDHVRTFYHDVWTHLRTGGIFVVAVSEAFGIPLEEQEARTKMLLPTLGEWDVVLVPMESLPFLVHMPGKETHALVFTKRVAKGGRRRYM